MVGLLANDQRLMDDVVGLLDFDAPPKPSIAPITSGASPSSASSDGGSKTSKQSVKREQEKARQRRYRQRLKDSREELLAQVDELTKQLEALKREAAARKKKMTKKKKRTKETETTDSQLAGAQWIEEATSLRIQLEAQQRQLVAAINDQAELNNRLRRMYSGWALPTLYTVPGVLYAAYLQQLDGCYARVDTVMNACGMASLPETTFNSVHKRESDGGVAYFQHVNKVALPYPFQQTCKVLQEVVISQGEAPACGGVEVAPDKYVFVKSREIKAANVGSLAQHYVSRQYFEENRMVLVWKMSANGDDGLTGLHADETGWLCIEPSSGGVVISACIQQAPMRYSSPCSPEPATKPFYDLLRESLEADKEQMTSCMERMLLEDVLTGIEC